MKEEKSEYIFELPMKVRDYEVDSEGIVNNANYLHYLEVTRHEFCEWAGCSFARMQAEGISPVLSRVEIDYKHPLRPGQHMVSKLRLERKGPLFVFFQDIFTPEGLPVVQARVEVACLENGRLSRGDALALAFERFL